MIRPVHNFPEFDETQVQEMPAVNIPRENYNVPAQPFKVHDSFQLPFSDEASNIVPAMDESMTDTDMKHELLPKKRKYSCERYEMMNDDVSASESKISKGNIAPWT
jgi:hypothetical protein